MPAQRGGLLYDATIYTAMYDTPEKNDKPFFYGDWDFDSLSVFKDQRLKKYGEHYLKFKYLWLIRKGSITYMWYDTLLTNQ